MRIGLIGTGAMGSALGAGWLSSGAQVVTSVAGRSARTRALVERAGLEVVGSVDDVVGSDIVVSVVPPGAALDAARTIAAACVRTGARPLVVDLNAVAPSTIDAIGGLLDGLAFVDGSISGPPPGVDRPTRVYLCGPDADRVPDNPWLDVVTLPGPLGRASALKMCTASMYKGSKALIMAAAATAREHDVLQPFLDDVARQWPEAVPGWAGDIALAVSKSARFVDEMHEIARTQAAAGWPGALFDGVASAYTVAMHSSLARTAPEDVEESPALEAVLSALADRPRRAVLFDFSGTLFHNESAAHALLAALGPAFVGRADELMRHGALNGSPMPTGLPDNLADVWRRRDLSHDAHRAAYTGSSRLAGLTATQADALYDRGVSPEAWSPYPDTVDTLRALHTAGVPVALVSNIGWDPRPVLRRYGVLDDLDALVLSDERGVLKPDAAIFAMACADLGADPGDCLMIGDDRTNDGGARAIGIEFRYVSSDASEREVDALWLAAGLPARAAPVSGRLAR